MLGSDYDYLIKTGIFGGKGSGKSALRERLAKDSYTENYMTRLDFTGSAFTISTLEQEGKTVKLQNWEVSDPRQIGEARGMHVALVCVDLSDENGISAAQEVIEQAKRFQESTDIIIVGTKVDDVSNRKVSSEALQDFAERNGIAKEKIVEFSAKTGENKDVLVNLIHANYAMRYPDRVSPQSAQASSHERKGLLSSFKQLFKKSSSSQAQDKQADKKKRPSPR